MKLAKLRLYEKESLRGCIKHAFQGKQSNKNSIIEVTSNFQLSSLSFRLKLIHSLISLETAQFCEAEFSSIDKFMMDALKDDNCILKSDPEFSFCLITKYFEVCQRHDKDASMLLGELLSFCTSIGRHGDIECDRTVLRIILCSLECLNLTFDICDKIVDIVHASAINAVTSKGNAPLMIVIGKLLVALHPRLLEYPRPSIILKKVFGVGMILIDNAHTNDEVWFHGVLLLVMCATLDPDGDENPTEKEAIKFFVNIGENNPRSVIFYSTKLFHFFRRVCLSKPNNTLKWSNFTRWFCRFLLTVYVKHSRFDFLSSKYRKQLFQLVLGRLDNDILFQSDSHKQFFEDCFSTISKCCLSNEGSGYLVGNMLDIVTLAMVEYGSCEIHQSAKSIFYNLLSHSSSIEPQKLKYLIKYSTNFIGLGSMSDCFDFSHLTCWDRLFILLEELCFSSDTPCRLDLLVCVSKALVSLIELKFSNNWDLLMERCSLLLRLIFKMLWKPVDQKLGKSKFTDYYLKSLLCVLVPLCSAIKLLDDLSSQAENNHDFAYLIRDVWLSVVFMRLAFDNIWDVYCSKLLGKLALCSQIPVIISSLDWSRQSSVRSSMFNFMNNLFDWKPSQSIKCANPIGRLCELFQIPITMPREHIIMLSMVHMIESARISETHQICSLFSYLENFDVHGIRFDGVIDTVFSRWMMARETSASGDKYRDGIVQSCLSILDSVLSYNENVSAKSRLLLEKLLDKYSWLLYEYRCIAKLFSINSSLVGLAHLFTNKSISNDSVEYYIELVYYWIMKGLVTNASSSIFVIEEYSKLHCAEYSDNCVLISSIVKELYFHGTPMYHKVPYSSDMWHAERVRASSRIAKKFSTFSPFDSIIVKHALAYAQNIEISDFASSIASTDLDFEKQIEELQNSYLKSFNEAIVSLRYEIAKKFVWKIMSLIRHAIRSLDSKYIYSSVTPKVREFCMNLLTHLFHQIFSSIDDSMVSTIFQSIDWIGSCASKELQLLLVSSLCKTILGEVLFSREKLIESSRIPNVIITLECWIENFPVMRGTILRLLECFLKPLCRIDFDSISFKAVENCIFLLKLCQKTLHLCHVERLASIPLSRVLRDRMYYITISLMCSQNSPRSRMCDIVDFIDLMESDFRKCSSDYLSLYKMSRKQFCLDDIAGLSSFGHAIGISTQAILWSGLLPLENCSSIRIQQSIGLLHPLDINSSGIVNLLRMLFYSFKARNAIVNEKCHYAFPDRYGNKFAYKIALKAVWGIDPISAVNFAEKFINFTVDDGKRKGWKHIEALLLADPTSLRADRRAAKLLLSISKKLTRFHGSLLHREVLYCKSSFLSCGIDILSTASIPSFSTSSSSSQSYYVTCAAAFALRCIAQSSPEDIIFFLPQLTQLLRQDVYGCIQDILFKLCLRHSNVCHAFSWYLDVECKAPSVVMNRYDDLPRQCSTMLQDIYSSFSFDVTLLRSLDNQKRLFLSLANISSELIGIPLEHRFTHLARRLNDINFPLHCFLVTNSHREIIDMDVGSARPLPSGDKCPYFLSFRTKERKIESQYPCRPFFIDEGHFGTKALNHENGGIISSIRKARKGHSNGVSGDRSAKFVTPKKLRFNLDSSLEDRKQVESTDDFLHDIPLEIPVLKPIRHIPSPREAIAMEEIEESCIFKANDDCRHDSLVIQIITILQRHFQKSGVPLIFVPYSVIPIRTGDMNVLGGIIEVLKNTQSLDQIAKAWPKPNSLSQYFSFVYGSPHSQAYVAAMENFVSSLAAYSVLCYLLAIKDRHDGNILLDNRGTLIHIDFGFILGLSPGANIGFERAPLKINKDMIALLGGPSGTWFKEFKRLARLGFLAAREVRNEIMILVNALLNSKMEFLSHQKAVSDFNNRFFPTSTEFEASLRFEALIRSATHSWTTGLYDDFQKLHNNVG